MEAKSKKIALVGHSKTSMMAAPFDDPSWEIWSLGKIHAKLPRWDVWFELHNLNEGRQRWRWDDDYWKFLTTDHGKPLLIGKPHPDVPHGIVYPWDHILQKYGSYFNNSLSLMIAYALEAGVTELSLYGVEMAQSDPTTGNGEYQHQRPSCEYMLGIATGRGVNVILPAGCELLSTPRIYALESDWGEAVNHCWARKHVLQQELAQVRQLQEELKIKQQFLNDKEFTLIGASNENDKHLRDAK